MEFQSPGWGLGSSAVGSLRCAQLLAHGIETPKGVLPALAAQLFVGLVTFFFRLFSSLVGSRRFQSVVRPNSSGGRSDRSVRLR